jgi:hypothetical protein
MREMPVRLGPDVPEATRRGHAIDGNRKTFLNR